MPANPEVVWSVVDHPELAAALDQVESWLPGMLSVFQEEMPAAPGHQAFAEPPLFRPPGNHRSFLYCPGALTDDRPGPGHDHGVVVFKGLEPAFSWFPQLLHDLRAPCYTPHSIAEHLVVEEGKIPGCVGLREAFFEAQAAQRLQTRYLATYGEPARAPLPLFVYRHSPDTIGRTREQLRAELSEQTFDLMAPTLDTGLGGYAYYYPAPPIRARDVDSMLANEPFWRRQLALLSFGDVSELVERWLQLFARLLVTGLLPGAAASRKRGICCQPQNACLDGGYVDVDSVVPVESLRSDADIGQAVWFSFEALTDTILTLLAGHPESVSGSADLLRGTVRSFVTARVGQLLAAEQDLGRHLDPRIAAFVTAPASVSDLVTILGKVAPYQNADALKAAVAFSDTAVRLIRVALPY
jgi:hypothetical protein